MGGFPRPLSSEPDREAGEPGPEHQGEKTQRVAAPAWVAMSSEHDPSGQNRQERIRQNQRYLYRESGPEGRGVTADCRLLDFHLRPPLRRRNKQAMPADKFAGPGRGSAAGATGLGAPIKLPNPRPKADFDSRLITVEENKRADRKGKPEFRLSRGISTTVTQSRRLPRSRPIPGRLKLAADPSNLGL